MVGVKYLTLINARSGYRSLKLNKQSHLTTFCHPFGRYRYIKLPFGVAVTGDMFQKKIDKLVSGMPMFTALLVTLIAGFDEQGRDHDVTLDKLLRICRQAKLKLLKDKCLCRCTSIPFLGEISQQGVSLDPSNVKAQTDIPPPKRQHETAVVFGCTKLLYCIFTSNAEVCEPLLNGHR